MPIPFLTVRSLGLGTCGNKGGVARHQMVMMLAHMRKRFPTPPQTPLQIFLLVDAAVGTRDVVQQNAQQQCVPVLPRLENPGQELCQESRGALNARLGSSVLSLVVPL